MNQRKDCIRNCKGVADMEFYQKIADYGNQKLGHMWDYTAEEILKFMEALVVYCIDKGEDVKGGEDFMLKQLEWQDGEGRVRINTWAT